MASLQSCQLLRTSCMSTHIRTSAAVAHFEPLRIYIDTSVLGGCFDVEFARWIQRTDR
jgi:hypothetical protein